VDEAVDHGGCDDVVGEGLAPPIRGTHIFPAADLAFDLRLCGSGVSC
jgi:hypothetical protein